MRVASQEEKMTSRFSRRDVLKASNRHDVLHLTLERECGDPTQDESGDKQPKHQAQLAENGGSLW